MNFDFNVIKTTKGNPNKTKNVNGYIKTYNITGKVIEDFVDNFDIVKLGSDNLD